MSTRSYVPNADGEGSIGVDTLKWGAMYVKSPAEDDNSQKVPSTAWVQNLISAVNTEISSLQSQMATMQVETLKKIFPVGSVYTSLTDRRNPSQILGFGTWEALPAGYTLIAQGSGSDSFGSYTYTAGQKYGERLHKLTTDELPSISGTIGSRVGMEGGIFERPATGVFSYLDADKGRTYKRYGDGSESWVTYHTAKLSIGKNTPHENIQPSIAAYVWRRTA